MGSSIYLKISAGSKDSKTDHIGHRDNDEIIAALNDYLRKDGYLVISANCQRRARGAIKRLEMEGQAGWTFDHHRPGDAVTSAEWGLIAAIVKKKYPTYPGDRHYRSWGEYPETLAAEAQADVVIEKPFELRYLDDVVA